MQGIDHDGLIRPRHQSFDGKRQAGGVIELLGGDAREARAGTASVHRAVLWRSVDGGGFGGTVAVSLLG